MYVISARVETGSYEMQTHDVNLTLFTAGPPSDLIDMHQSHVICFSSTSSGYTCSSCTSDATVSSGYTPVKSGFTDGVLLI